MPAGTWSLAAAFVVSGATIFGFLLLPRLTHRLNGPALSSLQSLWFVLFLLTPGVFGPLEQATNARLAAAGARGDPGDAVIRAATRTTLTLIGLTTATVVVGAPVLVRRAFDGNRTLIVMLIVALVGNGLLFLAEGVLSGQKRFGSYAATIAAEGALRFLACAGLVLADVRTVSAYALVVALTPWAALLVAYASSRPSRSATTADRSDHGMRGDALTGEPTAAGFGRAVAHLMGGQLALQAMLNIAPLAATLLATSRAEKGRAADFGTAFLVSRVPLFLFQAVSITLLAELAGLSAIGDRRRVRQIVGRLCAGLTLVGVIGTGAAALLGRLLSDRILGSHANVGRLTWAALAAANSVGLVALTVSVMLTAKGRLARYGLGWLAGATVAVLVMAAVHPLTTRVTAAYLAGMVATTAALCAFAASRRPSGGWPQATG